MGTAHGGLKLCDIDAVVVRNMDVIPEEAVLPDGMLVIGAQDLDYMRDDLDLETMSFEIPKRRQSDEYKQSRLSAVKEAFRLKKESGESVGFVPFGYERDNGNLIPNESITPNVKQIFEKAKENAKLTVIAAWLD